jgi:putative component of toxin-antitoxin plasmid stabilization module
MCSIKKYDQFRSYLSDIQNEKIRQKISLNVGIYQ